MAFAIYILTSVIVYPFRHLAVLGRSGFVRTAPALPGTTRFRLSSATVSCYDRHGRRSLTSARTTTLHGAHRTTWKGPGNGHEATFSRLTYLPGLLVLRRQHAARRLDRDQPITISTIRFRGHYERRRRVRRNVRPAAPATSGRRHLASLSIA